jgi:hypothetical protein
MKKIYKMRCNMLNWFYTPSDMGKNDLQDWWIVHVQHSAYK